MVSFPLLQLRRVTVAVLMGFLCASQAAANTPAPASVTIAGSLQQELGCPADWLPDCETTHLSFDADDDVWQGNFTVPAGDWEYKAPLNDNWSENYGVNATLNGANIPLHLGGETNVKFYYDHKTHWVADNHEKVIAVAPGSFQSELGCPGDWQPDCLRSWLQDPDGDGIYGFIARLPAGDYEAKVALNESWDVNYGAGGVQNGPNIAFTVPADCNEMQFTYDPGSHVLTIAPAADPLQPTNVTVAGSLQSELGCPGDWMPDCATTHLGFDTSDGVWQAIFNVPAGNWEYKAPLNDSWTENYGLHAQRDGANIPLNLTADRPVKFYYEHGSHWITDNVNSVIAVAPGSFQSELGCPGDWQPDCLRSWLQDPDGDGIFAFSTRALPAGEYEAKVALYESWDINYGANGEQNGANIPFTVPSSCTEIFFTYNSTTHVLTVGAQGAPAGNIRRAQAHWVAAGTVAWNLGSFQPSWSVQLHYDLAGGLELGPDGVSGGITIPLQFDPAGLPQEVRDKFPHLASYRAFTVPADRMAEVPVALKGQLAVSATASDGTLIDATSLQIPGALDDLYTYDGPLGVTFNGNNPTLRVWAPTARSVRLHLFADSDPETESSVLPMTVNPATGVWSVTGNAGWKGQFYLYEVEVWVRGTNAVETNLVTDPYSLSLSGNSQRSQIVNLSDSSLKPPGWASLSKPRLDAPEDTVLYELHVRDFSASDDSLPATLQGTFKAFTVASDGMRHLKALAKAGLTHVHLLPSFDIATIDEDKSHWQSPGDLSDFPPDSTEQQAAVAAVADLDAFNWGYDPWHYTVPEGSYSTDPDGSTRIREFREMVRSLNRNGLRVVMDVVYNHTNAAGQNDHSVLDRIVPGYYHRLNTDGNVETSSCCQNTASEHNMMEKLLIDSVLTWAKDYKVDGFRFDLMGHHMKRNIVKLRAALDALTPAANGVDGKKVILYGEGWNFGEVANNARGVQATQANMAGTGVGTFSDRLRDGARGGGPFSGIQEQGFLTGLYDAPNATDQGSPAQQRDRLLQELDWIRVGMAGGLAAFPIVDRFGNHVLASQIDYNGQPTGYTADPQEVINYVEAHDNDTLFDAIQLKVAIDTPMDQRVRRQDLGMSLLLLGQGIPFLHAGVELLRSKSLDRNSYNSGDWFNKLDYTYESNNWGVGLPPERDNGSNWGVMAPLLGNPSLQADSANILDAYAHLREMLAIRKSLPLLRLRTASDIISQVKFYNVGPSQIPDLLVMAVTDDSGSVDRGTKRVVALLNGAVGTKSLSVEELAGRNLKLHPIQKTSSDPVVRTSTFNAGTFTVPGLTAAVFVEQRPAIAQIDLLIADIRGLKSDGTLGHRPRAVLRATLQVARAIAIQNKPNQATSALRGFQVEVRLFIGLGLLPTETGDDLIRKAGLAIAALAS